MSRVSERVLGMGWCFPRVSGDEPKARRLIQDARMFSPRERG